MEDVKVITPEGYEFTMPEFIREAVKNENFKLLGTHSNPASQL